MKNLYIAILSLSMLMLSACASITSDIQVETDVDARVDMSAYKTFAWLGTASVINDPQGHWEPMGFDADAEIQFLIDEELRNKGLTELSSDPDLMVGFALGVDMEALKLVQDDESNLEVLVNVPKGALIVALVDARSGRVVWAGKARANIQQEYTDEESKKRLAYAVSSMLKSLSAVK